MRELDIYFASRKEIEEATTIFNRFNFSYTGNRTLKFADKELEIALIAKKDDQTVGFCYADKKDANSRTRKTAYIGCFIIPDYQSGGIGTMLIENLLVNLKERGFIRAECDIAEENIGSLKLIENLGFKREGILKKRFLTDDGRMIDDYYYGKIIK